MIFEVPESEIASMRYDIDQLELQTNNRNGWIFVEDFPGDTIDQQLTAAVEQLPRWPDYGGTLVLPAKKVLAQDTWTWARQADNPSPADLLRGVTIIGNGCQIVWEGDDNKPIWDLPSPWYCRIQGPLQFSGRDDLTSTVAIYHRPAWGWNVNTSRCLGIDRVYFHQIPICYYAGDPMGPDITNTTIDNCFAYRCGNFATVAGANVFGHLVNNCNLMCYGPCIHSVGFGKRYFRDNAVVDCFGNVLTADQYGTDVWLARRMGDADTGYFAGGGGASITVRDGCYGTVSDVGTKYTFHADGGAIKAYAVHIESKNSGVYLSNSAGGGSSFSDTYMRCVLEDIEDYYSAGIAINQIGGYSLLVRGGVYRGAFITNDDRYLRSENVISHSEQIIGKSIMNG